MGFKLISTLDISDEDLSIIEHRVAQDPFTEANPGMRIGEAWVKRVHESLGVKAFEAITDKVNRYREQYAKDRETYGVGYKNAAQRAEVKRLALVAEAEATAKKNAEAEEQRVSEFEAAVDAAVEKRMKK